MKKLFWMLTILMMIFGLAACTQQSKDIKEKSNVTGQKEVKDTNGSANENKKQKSKDEGTPTQNSPVSNVPADMVYQNEIFKDVKVSLSGDEFIVTGKAQVFEGNFQYALYNGEKVLMESNYQTAGAPAWGDFKMTFSKALVTSDEVTLELFDYSAKDGSKVNTLEIPIPKPQ